MTTADIDWLTVNEVAGRLKVSTSTVRRWIRSGKLPVGRAPNGRLIRIQMSAVNEMLTGTEQAHEYEDELDWDQ